MDKHSHFVMQGLEGFDVFATRRNKKVLLATIYYHPGMGEQWVKEGLVYNGFPPDCEVVRRKPN